MPEPSVGAALDVVVIGAGPAGLAAAVEAAGAGAHVVLLDEQERPGGQYWRQGPAGLGPHHHDHAVWRELADALAAHRAAGRIDHRCGHRVWRVEALPGVGPGRVPAAVVHAVAVPSGR
jgi:flavin-dependent dehydrogenase